MSTPAESTCVKSRQIIDAFLERIGVFLVPVFQGLNGRKVAQRFLRNVLIIDLGVKFNSIGQVTGRIEAGGGQDLGDATVEALDHAVGLRGSGFDRTMFDVVLGTHPIEGVGTGWLALAGSAKAVGKFLAVVGEDLAELERGFLDQAVEKAAFGGC